MSTDEQGDRGSTHRSRSLTERGQSAYESFKLNQLTKLDKLWQEIEDTILSSKDNSDLQSLRQSEKQLCLLYRNFKTLSVEYLNFLFRTGTEESTVEFENEKKNFEAKEKKVDDTLTLFDQQMQGLLESTSQRPPSESNMSIILARKRAEAESAYIALSYAKKEATLRVQQAKAEEEQRKHRVNIETELDILQREKAAAVAEAEVRILEASEGSGRSHRSLRLFEVPREDPIQRTQHYVQQIPVQNFEDDAEKNQSHVPSSQLNPCAPTFNPMSDISRFLLKKDLLFSRLRTFNDQPESYAIWKSSFSSVMTDLQVTPVEEMDFLVKWLGPDSSRHAISLRSSYASDPSKGIQKLWERLDERYGAPEMVELSLKQRLDSFPKLTIKDTKKLYDLADLLSEVEAVKENDRYKSLLSYFDSSSGVNPIVSKLPFFMQDKWVNHAFRYKETHNASFPPFSVFVTFIRNMSKIKNDPSFSFESLTMNPLRRDARQSGPNRFDVNSKKTDLTSEKGDRIPRCPLHNSRHTLNECRGFKAKPLPERNQLLKRFGFCYRCCLSKHLTSTCSEVIKCTECGSSRHPTALHISVEPLPRLPCPPGKLESRNPGLSTAKNPVTSKCTQVCGLNCISKSCAKTILVDVQTSNPEKWIRAYAILDDQSNVSLARSELFDILGVKTDSVPYTLSSCAGTFETTGRRARDISVRSIDGTCEISIPWVTECNQIPETKEEIPTPEVAMHHDHLTDIAEHIPPLDDSADILLLIGRDVIEAHHVLDQRIGSGRAPYAQKLRLGWVIIGEACLGKVHRPDYISVNKTNLLPDGRQSIFKVCPNHFRVKEFPSHEAVTDRFDSAIEDKNIFETSKDDEKPGLSVEDREFLNIMSEEMKRTEEGNWIAPLPFRPGRQNLPNNRSHALHRAMTLHRSLLRDDTKRKHFVEFMDKLFSNNHAEIAPPLDEKEERWYLPVFGVYHPKKPDQIRVVFDSSAKFSGISLNDVLLQGPDLTNSLLGVILRFRREKVAAMADIQQMFYCFQVAEKHRNYLRFLWYRDNDPKKQLVEYRMRVHVFGNSPSPAVATYGLRQAAKLGSETYGQDITEFVLRDFYVDDGLTSQPTSYQAADLLKRTQKALFEGGRLKLHKITSNSKDLMTSFPPEELSKDMKELDLGSDTIPLQRSLGMSWDLEADSFTFKVSEKEKPFTKRGVVSTINSIYDPLGFAAPVIIQGKMLFRELMKEKAEWDKQLPPQHEQEWTEWRQSLHNLEQLKISRPFCPSPFANASNKSLHVFADASEKAIAAVCYLKLIGYDGKSHTGFVLGKSKIAPSHGHTIPRLELCAALLAVEVARQASEHLDMPLADVSFYTDSRVVLGYINNQKRRFLTYVSNRVEKIRKYSNPQQWSYVATDNNPADNGTRSVAAHNLQTSSWLKGPKLSILRNHHAQHDAFELYDEDNDKELKPLASSMKTEITTEKYLDLRYFEKFSTWQSLVRALTLLRKIVRHHQSSMPSTQTSEDTSHPMDDTERFLIRTTQRHIFYQEIHCLSKKEALSKKSLISKLDPFLDDQGILRVGGRIMKSDVESVMKRPIIIPGKTHVARLLILHYHTQTKHQGRHFTEGAIRSAGYWITGAKRIISSLLYKCVTCRKLRGSQETQKMAELPEDRLKPCPPFTFVGVDVFGPWEIVSRRTRGGTANSKRWAVLFSCLVTRAIHIEVIEEMTSSSFINALRRFISIRGKVKQFRSDRGTNFVAAAGELNTHVVNVEDVQIKNFLNDNRTTWLFNPPHASHMGGAWERMIGIARRILDSMLREAPNKKLTHEVLTTFMAEVTAIVNARPIIPVSTDSESPFVLTPSTLLTQKLEQVSEPMGDFNLTSMYKTQWKRVQALADEFWKRWKHEYLHTLQQKSKWHNVKPNLQEGDVVLLKDKTSPRNDWPIAVVHKTLPSRDTKVRKAIVRVAKSGKVLNFTRPVVDMILLLPSD